MDELYINKVLNGERDAYGYLIRQHQTVAMRTAMSIVKNETEAKDIVQNSFIQAYESLQSFKGESKFSTWLCRIVANKSFRFIQNKARKTNFEKKLIIHDTPFAYNEGLLNLNRQDLNELLKKGLKLLTPNEALCLQLFYLEEHHLDEIEKITNFSKSNIKVLLFRGRKNLYHHLITSYNKTQ